MPALWVQQLQLPLYPTLVDLQGQQSLMNLNNYFKNTTSQMNQWSAAVTNAINGGLLPVQAVSTTFGVGVSATGAIVTISPAVPAGCGFMVLFQPSWNSGPWWVTPSNGASLTLNWTNPTPATTTFGLAIAMDRLPV